jgi:hypothetical protein
MIWNLYNKCVLHTDAYLTLLIFLFFSSSRINVSLETEKTDLLSTHLLTETKLNEFVIKKRVLKYFPQH